MDTLQQCSSQNIAAAIAFTLFAFSEAIGAYRGTNSTGVLHLFIDAFRDVAKRMRRTPSDPPAPESAPVSPAPPVTV